MSEKKVIKSYNETTGQWEEVNNLSKTVIEYKGEDVNAKNVYVDAPLRVYDDDDEHNVNKALVRIDEKLSRHDGYISYLAQHGGSGGSGGGGQSFAFGIKFLDVLDNKVIIKNPKFSLHFQITGGTSSMVFQYRVRFDGKYLTSTYNKANGNKDIVITIEDVNMYKTTSPHTLTLDVLDPYNMAVECPTIEITEASLKIETEKQQTLTIGSTGIVSIKVLNKVKEKTYIDFETTYNGGKITYEYSFDNKTTNEQILQIPLVGPDKLFKNEVRVSQIYNVKVTAKSDTITEPTDAVNITVTFVGTEQLSIIFYSLSTPEEFESGSVVQKAIGEKLTFNFMPSIVPPNKYIIPQYNYSVALFKGKYDASSANIGTLIYGSYFDESIKKEGKTYRDNPIVKNNTKATITWVIDPNVITEVTDEGWSVVVRCWDSKGMPTTSFAMCNFVKTDGSIFEQQIPNRGTDGKTLLARWSSKVSFPEKKEKTWISSCNYTSCQQITSLVNIPLDIYFTNGEVSGFLENVLKLRNNAYAYANLLSYKDEINEWVARNTLGSCEGFDISVTFKSEAHSDGGRTVFLFGNNNQDGELSEGFRIDLEKIYWKIPGISMMEVDIQQELVNTVDFIYNGNIAKIMVNGTVQKSVDVIDYSFSESFSYQIYVACGKIKNEVTKFSDISIYDISIFGKSTNDLEVIINAKNNKIIGDITEDIKKEYQNWKYNNFFVASAETPTSYLFENDEYEVASVGLLNRIVENSPLPVLYLDAVGTDFTRSYYYGYSVSTDRKFNGLTMTYYTPEYKQGLTINDVSTAIQGTSSANYHSKNLEIYMPYDTETEKQTLFQPKEEWFPEEEFTLKSDVVDSGHINNATIGYWINNYATKIDNFLEANPAMDIVNNNDNCKPEDAWTKDDGTVIRPESETIRHSNLNIKHNLEGFPVILVVKFADEVEDREEMLGIFSFNLGRYAYYNMGMKFLERFTRRTYNEDNGTLSNDPGCPAAITNFKATNTISSGDKTINTENIFSFEFDTTADENTPEYNLWSQYDVSVLQHVGSFRYPTSIGLTDPIWGKLSNLFSYTASVGLTSPRPYYIVQDGIYKLTTNVIPVDSLALDKLREHFSIKNAYAYFTIMNAFGMVDSSGKNMTLRTWDGGEHWYICFYDMDTALKLDNVGNESVLPTVYIDYYTNDNDYEFENPYYNEGETITVNTLEDVPVIQNKRLEWTLTPLGKYTFRNPYYGKGRVIHVKDFLDIIQIKNNRPQYETMTPTDRSNQMKTGKQPYHNTKVGITYGLYNSKLWEILRTINLDGISFSLDWLRVRTSKVAIDVDSEHKGMILSLADANNFVSLIEARMGSCGEMLYNMDYKIKYLTKFKASEDEPEKYGNIGFLHGNRIETIRKWLKEHIYFLDGVFEDSSDNFSTEKGNIPFYSRQCQFAWEGPGVDLLPKLVISSSSPSVVRVNTGGGTGYDAYQRFFVNGYEDTEITLTPFSDSGSKQTNININNLLIKLDKLNQNQFLSFNENRLPSLSYIDLSGLQKITGDNPISFESSFTKKSREVSGITYFTSEMEKIDLNNTRTLNNGNLPVTLYVNNVDNITEYDKLTDLDISNSSVTTLTLPKVSFRRLLVSGSKIDQFVLSNQPLLSSFSLRSCSNLTKADIDTWDNLETLDLGNLSNIQSLRIANCPKLKSIILNNAQNLLTVDINNCEGLLSIEFTNDINLSTVLLQNLNSLKELTIKGNTNENIDITMNGIGPMTKIDFTDSLLRSFSINSDAVSTLEYLVLNNSINFNGIKFNGEDIETYDSAPVLDLSYFKSLDSKKLLIEGASGIVNMRLPENFILTDEYFETNYGLKRIFGTLNISGTSIFSECYEFSLGKEKFDEKKYITDIEFKTANISGCFANTNVTLKDVESVLGKCDNVTNISNLFRGCKNIHSSAENPLPEELFDKCTNVVDASGLFSGCENMGGPICHYDEEAETEEGNYTILKPLTKIESFDGVFPPSVTIDSYIFMYSGCSITEISNFNPICVEPVFLYDDMLLTMVTGLKSIKNSFNGVSVSFSSKSVTESGTTYHYCPLFCHNENLTYVESSFTELVKCSTNNGSVGIERPFIKNRNLKTFISSLTLKENSTNYLKERINFHITDDLLGSCKNTIVNIGKTVDGEYKDEIKHSFSGFDKYIYLGEGYSHLGNDGDFPYDIVNGCPELQSCFGLYDGLTAVIGFNDDSTFIVRNAVPTDNFILPSEGMFSGSTKLVDVSNMFSNMNGFRYKLNGFQFKELGIRFASHIFSDKYSMRMGMIPYGLFLNSGNTIEDLSYALSDCASKETECYNTDWIDISEEFPHSLLLLDNGEGEVPRYSWNKYICDGVNTKIKEYYNGLTEEQQEKVEDIENLPTVNTDIYENRKSIFIGDNYSNLIPFEKSKLIITRNYFCPPDIFRYCKSNAKVNGVFSGCGKHERDSQYTMGVYGTICPFIFESVNETLTLENIFAGCMYILPSKWSLGYKVEIGSETKWRYDGEMYPSSLFSGLTDVYSIAGIFNGNTIWGGTEIPNNLFTPLGDMLDSVANLFANVTWIWVEKGEDEDEEKQKFDTDGSNYPQLPNNSFETNKKLHNVSNMLSGGKGTFYINSNLLNSGDNSLINNCSSFMRNTPSAQGSIPTFWKFSNYPNYMQYKSAFYNTNPSIGGYETAKDKGMTTEK